MAGGEERGRVLVFSIAGCGFCKKAKALLKEKGLDYAEVNLDVFPERREEAMERSGMSTLPQIYFNDHLIGGYSELRACFDSPQEEAKILAFLEERASPDAPQPSDSSRNAEAVEDVLHLEEDECAAIVRRMRDTETGVSVGDRFYHLKKYPKCFVGQEAVRWFMEKEGMSRVDAIALGRRLFERRFFNHVCLEHEFEDKYLFYRFIDAHYSKALNMSHLSLHAPLPAPEVAEKLRRLILAIYDEFLSEDGKTVDYEGIGKSHIYRRYVTMSHALQRVDLSLLSRAEKIAFFINLYNALVVHANVESGEAKSWFDRGKFFSTSSYVVGGLRFSLNDIEHGILRGNKKAPYALTKSFTGSDPRQRLSVADVDARIHFALVCGAKGCPPIKMYKASKLEEDLAAATKAFLDSEVSVDASKGVVTVSKLLDWYASDFGSDDHEVMGFILANCSEKLKAELKVVCKDGFKFSYSNYDWTSNSK